MIETVTCERQAVRLWKRDGTKNLMTPDIAARVAASNILGPHGKQLLSPQAALTRLLVGERLETPFSVIYLE